MHKSLSLLAAWVALAPLELSAWAAKESIAIATAVDRSMASNPSVIELRQKVEEADHLVHGAWSQAFPNLQTTFSALRKKDAAGRTSTATQEYNSYDAQLKLTQPLYVGGAFWAGLASTKKEFDIRKLDLEIAERDTTIQVLNAFYSVQLNQRKVDTLKRTEAVEKESLQTADRRFKIGRGQLLDVLQIKTQLALLSSKIAQAQRDLDSSLADLTALLSDKSDQPPFPKGWIDLSKVQALMKKIQDRKLKIPEIQKTQTQLEQAENKKDVQMAKHWPQLNLVGAMGRTSYNKIDFSSDSTQSWSVGLQLTIPLFSGLSSVYERRSLNSQIQQLESEQSHVQDRIAADEEKAERALVAAESVIQATQTTLGFARDSVKEAQKNYKLATIDYLQFLSVQQSQLDAELAHDQAEFEYISSLAKYMAASGHPLKDLVQALTL